MKGSPGFPGSRFSDPDVIIDLAGEVAVWEPVGEEMAGEGPAHS